MYSSTLFLTSALGWGWWSEPRLGHFDPVKIGTQHTGDWVGRSWWVRKISLPPGFYPRTVQFIASRCSDWAIPVHNKQCPFVIKSCVHDRYDKICQLLFCIVRRTKKFDYTQVIRYNLKDSLCNLGNWQRRPIKHLTHKQRRRRPEFSDINLSKHA
jgi:hypothetical protein